MSTGLVAEAGDDPGVDVVEGVSGLVAVIEGDGVLDEVGGGVARGAQVPVPVPRDYLEGGRGGVPGIAGTEADDVDERPVSRSR